MKFFNYNFGTFKAFVALIVQSHQEQVNLSEIASNGVNDPDLRTLATNKLPVLREHLEHAQQLNATVNW
jgi:putative membrane protein